MPACRWGSYPCFVLPVLDFLPDIFEALKSMSLIHQSGGGTGFSFSRLRPRKRCCAVHGGVASGPVSSMRIFDVATDVIKQGGRRRGANMGRSGGSTIRISWSSFMPRRGRGCWRTLTYQWRRRTGSCTCPGGGEIDLINPRTGLVQGSIDAGQALRAIANSAWQGGDPGMIFIDRINAAYPLQGEIESTNPCGEQPLLPYESCNLGLHQPLKDCGAAGDRLGEEGALVDISVSFLDDVIDMNRYPLPRIEEVTLQSRKIGLGVMGFATDSAHPHGRVLQLHGGGPPGRGGVSEIHSRGAG